MFFKYICADFQCGTYVFGINTNGNCPECGAQGYKTTEEEDEAFLTWYNETMRRARTSRV